MGGVEGRRHLRRLRAGLGRDGGDQIGGNRPQGAPDAPLPGDGAACPALAAEGGLERLQPLLDGGVEQRLGGLLGGVG